MVWYRWTTELYGAAEMVVFYVNFLVWGDSMQWEEQIVNLFKKGDKEDPGNYRGITAEGKAFFKLLK